MNERNSILKCLVCGNIVTVSHPGKGELTCCGQPMKNFLAGATDGAKEKHVPVIAKVDGGYKVTVGSVAHPMEEKHYIEWIELLAGDLVQREYLKPGMKPEAFFRTGASTVTAREYCNLHGLWKKDSE